MVESPKMLNVVSGAPTIPLDELRTEKFASVPVETKIFVPTGFPLAPIVMDTLVVKTWNPLIECTADKVLVEAVMTIVFVDPVGFRDPDWNP